MRTHSTNQQTQNNQYQQQTQQTSMLFLEQTTHTNNEQHITPHNNSKDKDAHRQQTQQTNKTR